MLWVPTARAAVGQVAVRMFPEPASATAEQLPIDDAPSLKFTVPVGAVPVTVAVKDTLVPAMDGVSEVPTLVVLLTLLTVWESVLLVDAVLLASPP
jgi:hypothetical protein